MKREREMDNQVKKAKKGANKDLAAKKDKKSNMNLEFFEITPNDNAIEIIIDLNNIFSEKHERELFEYLSKNKVNFIIYKIFTHNILVNKNKIRLEKEDVFIESRCVIELDDTLSVPETIKNIYKKLIDFRNNIVNIH